MLLRPALVLTVLIGSTSDPLVAQVRMDLRANTQIDTLLPTNLSTDERWWPLKANAFAVGDVDGDGDLDVLAADNDGWNRIWFNDGDGAFLRYASLPTFGGGRSCALFDADDDGDLDALVGGGRTAYEGPGVTRLFENDGAGEFVPVSGVPSLNARVQSVAAGDLDGDGDADILLFADGLGLRLWRNDSAMVFTDQTPIAGLGGVIAGSAVRCGLRDIDADNDLDIVLGPPWMALANDGAGQFTPVGAVAALEHDERSALADFDGDAAVEVFGFTATGTPELWDPDVDPNAPVTALWFEPHALQQRTVGYLHAACIAFDADGDGDVDLLTGGCEGRGTTSTTVGIPPTLFLNEGGQRFVDAGRPAFPMTQAPARAMAAGDIDGDGDVDLLCVFGPHYASGTWVDNFVWKQDGAGRFHEAGGSPFGDAVSALVLADVDSDGDLDLLGVAGWGPYYPGVPGQHRLALNDGTGAFVDVTATHMPASAVTGGASGVAGDVDGDGDMDFVIGSYFPNWGGAGVPLRLLTNDGTGVFVDASSQLPATPFEASHVQLCDVDGDGDLDLVAARNEFHMTATRSVVLFVNDGSGVFADESAARLPSTAGAHGLGVLDLDGDGDPDLVQSGVDLWNGGTGHFSATTAAARILVADFDGDGAVEDLVDGLGLQVGGRTVFRDEVPQGHLVTALDLDQDQDLDLVVAPVLEAIGADWYTFRMELVYNLHRDLRVVTSPRVGQPYRVRLRSTNGGNATGVVVAIATAALTAPQPLGEIGVLRLDPGMTVPFGVGIVPDSDSALEVSFPIPGQPSLVGLPLAGQALFFPFGGGAPHLSNAMVFPIGG